MHDGVEPGPLLIVDERLRGQRGTVQRTVGQQDLVTELVDQGGQALGAGLTTSGR